MAYIKLDTKYPVYDGMPITFEAPCDCTATEGVTVGSQNYSFADAHGAILTGIGNLFMKGALVKVILDTTKKLAYVQNADTNSYLEGKADKATLVTNADATTVKPVPATSAPYAKMLEIGGKTRKCTNLFDLNRASTDSSVSTVNGDTLTIKGYMVIVTFDNLKVGETYTFSAKSKRTGSDGGGVSIEFYNSDGQRFGNCRYLQNTLNPSVTFTVDEGTSQIKLYLYGRSTASGSDSATYSNIMLNEGTTPLPYEPYFEGLRSAVVTEVESVGVNLLAYPYKNTTKTVNGVTYTDNGDGSVSFSGTPTAYSDFSLYTMSRVAKGAYYLSLLGNYQNIDVYVVFLGSGDTTISEKNYRTSGIVNVSDYPETTRIVFSLKRRDNGVACSGTMRIMLNEGTTAQPYAPYVRHSLPIPAEVQGLDGYGWGVSDSVYNYIDFEKKQFVKQVGRVDMGTLGWDYTSSGQGRFQAALPNKAKESNAKRQNALCVPYTVGSINGVYNGSAGIAVANDSKVWVYDKAYTGDATAFKAAMAGVMLYYELAEPVIEPIADLLPADNYIGVEGGGTVTMVSEYGYDVPSKVNFYEDTNEIVASHSFVGDLEGTASRAIADKDGNPLLVFEKTKLALPSPSKAIWRAIAYGNDRFVATNGSGTYAGFSTNGTDWVSSSLPINYPSLCVAYGDGKFVALGYDQTYPYRSTDGITWMCHSGSLTGYGSSHFTSIAYGNGKFVAVAHYTNSASYTTDGLVWDDAGTLPSTANWSSITYGGGKFVTVASGGTKAAYSTDGVQWTSATLPESAYWKCVTYGGGKFVAVATNSATVAYSADGTTWSSATMPESDWQSVAYGNGRFVAVGHNHAAYSYDGITWVAANVPDDALLNAVTYGNGRFVAVGDDTCLAYSLDGDSWTTTRGRFMQGNIDVTATVLAALG